MSVTRNVWCGPHRALRTKGDNGSTQSRSSRKMWARNWATSPCANFLSTEQIGAQVGDSGIVIEYIFLPWCPSTALPCTNSCNNYKDVRGWHQTIFNSFGFSDPFPNQTLDQIPLYCKTCLFLAPTDDRAQKDQHYNIVFVRTTLITQHTRYYIQLRIEIIPARPKLWEIWNKSSSHQKWILSESITEPVSAADAVSKAQSVRKLCVLVPSVTQLYLGGVQ